jgi:hypothetical protein
MPRKQQSGERRLQPKYGRLRRAASSIARMFKRAGGRERPAMIGSDDPTLRTVPAPKTRPVHRESDIPLDQIEQTYTPAQTSLKSPFRASGADQQSDQEFARGVADDRWNDEDRFTNKSGDPRIGTHGRTHEPVETRVARGHNEND